MGCGSERSDWDDKAVQDSLAGKNTELDPKILEEGKGCHEARVELQEKTTGFEKSGVVQDRDMVRAISYVPLARELAKELGIHSINFKEDLVDRGKSWADKDGAKIFIGSVGNTSKIDYQRTLFHELGELYCKYVLPPEKVIDWIEMRKEATVLTPIEDKDKEEGKDDNYKGQHHFAERFADYCMAQLFKDSKAREEKIHAFRTTYPGQAQAFDKLIGK